MKLYKFFFLMFLAGLFACTDLEEQLNDNLTKAEAEAFLNETADVAGLLRGSYQLFRTPYMEGDHIFAAWEHTGDLSMGPTRGGDWDDNGVWRDYHLHSWQSDASRLVNTFNQLLGIVFSTTNVLSFVKPAQVQEAAEARFLRAFVMLQLADGWNQVPFRDPGENLLNAPRVLIGAEIVDFVIDECNAIMGDLPDGPTNRANKDAAKVLLMKAHLNRGVFATADARQSPKFETADMDQVISLANQLAANYSIDDEFFDNFAPNNDAVSSENIWTHENVGGSSSGNTKYQYRSGLHYNQNPDGWNGFCTLGDFYDSFEGTDTRTYKEYPGSFEEGGINTGFLIGQQFDGDGNALQDRKGNALAFTKEINIIESGNDLEIKGIRVCKYVIDYNNLDQTDNDWVFYRYADVLLMKAEAMLRNGNAGDALIAVNELRMARGATPFTTLTEENLLAERGRELYWEGHRRTDLIRFGKFLDAWQEKPVTTSERLLFPIPPSALAVNPNLKQNPGY